MGQNKIFHTCAGYLFDLTVNRHHTTQNHYVLRTKLKYALTYRMVWMILSLNLRAGSTQ